MPSSLILNIDAFEPNREMLRWYRQNVSGLKDIKIRSVNAYTTESFTSRTAHTFNVVFSGHSLYYSKPECALRLIQKVRKGGLLLIHISKLHTPMQELFTLLRKKTGSEAMEGLFQERSIAYTSHRVDFRTDITEIVRYLNGEIDNQYGKAFLTLFVGSSPSKELIQRVQEIINQHTSPDRNGKTFLRGQSTIFVVKR